MTLLARYLLGNRDAILHFARARYTIVLGFVFCLIAGLAREYDGTYLPDEPWAVLKPALVSATTAFLLLFLMGMVGANRWATAPRFPGSYRALLGLFWMTAPLGWLYAIPVERWLAEYDATVANLVALALVATWRVALMSRVVYVLTSGLVMQSIALVLFFSCMVAGLASTCLIGNGRPLIAVMAGIRPTPAEVLIANVQASTFCGAGIGCLIFGGLLAFASPGSRPGQWVWPAVSDRSVVIPRSLWLLAGAALVGIGAMLPGPQEKLARAADLRRLWNEDRIDETVELIIARGPDAFLPHFDPDPKPGLERAQRSCELVGGFIRRDRPRWLREYGAAKLNRMFDSYRYWHDGRTADYLGTISNDVRDLLQADIGSLRENWCRIASNVVRPELRELLSDAGGCQSGR